jgi:hypothetical protein
MYMRDGQTYGLCNDDQGYVDGWDNDSICGAWGGNSNGPVELPKQMNINQNSDSCGFNFGSVHTQLLAVFCDGSVHAINYDVTADTWLALCVINDGKLTNFED